MRILFGIDTWGVVGGTERYAAVVVPALIERGHDVVVLCREALPDGLPRELHGVPVLEMPTLDGASMSRVERAELAGRVRDLEPDVAFLQVARNLDALAALCELLPVVRFVHDHTLFCPGLNKFREDGELCDRPLGLECLSRYWMKGGCVCFKPAGHGNRLVDPLRELQAKFREIDINRAAATLVTNSAYMAGELVRAGFDPHRVRALPLFTRSNSPAQPGGPLPEATEAFLAQGDEPVVFTPARLTLPDKGVDYLISALAALQRPFRAVVAGTGPAEEWLRQKAVDDGVADRVHFTGWLDGSAIETLFERADVVACPSVWNEPFGLVGLEAMAHAKPVVAFSVGGVPEWLDDGDTGYLIPRCDVGAFAAALDRLLGDPELAREMGRAGSVSLGERYSPEQHMDLVVDVLERAAD